MSTIIQNELVLHALFLESLKSNFFINVDILKKFLIVNKSVHRSGIYRSS